MARWQNFAPHIILQADNQTKTTSLKTTIAINCFGLATIGSNNSTMVFTLVTIANNDFVVWQPLDLWWLNLQSQIVKDLSLYLKVKHALFSCEVSFVASCMHMGRGVLIPGLIKMQMQLATQFIPFSSAHSAYCNVSLQKVPYSNVSRHNRVVFKC